MRGESQPFSAIEQLVAVGFRGSPVKFAALLFCEKFNWASRVQEIIVNKQRLIINS
jgi:hypothetical protein